MDLIKKPRAVYLLTYHCVFVVKYRKKVINEALGDFLKNDAAYIIERFDGKLVSAETDEDHIHILMSLPPHIAPGAVVKTLKTHMSREAHKYYGEYIKQFLRGEGTPFWTPSYYIATTGTTSLENVKAYIESQRTDEHKRKYTKSGKYKKSSIHPRRN